jgi:DNA-binding protein H-NS
MSIDLKTLSAKELQKLIAEANRERKRKQKRAPIAQVRAKLTRMATAEGYSLLELFGVKDGARPRGDVRDPQIKRGGARSSTKGTKVAPKYRNPANPAETWSGRGKQPRWLATAVANGGRLEDFKI